MEPSKKKKSNKTKPVEEDDDDNVEIVEEEPHESPVIEEAKIKKKKSKKNEDNEQEQEEEMEEEQGTTEKLVEAERPKSKLIRRKSSKAGPDIEPMSGQLFRVTSSSGSGEMVSVNASEDGFSILALNRNAQSRKTAQWKNIVAIQKQSEKSFTVIGITEHKNFKKYKRLDWTFVTKGEEETNKWISYCNPLIHSNSNSPKNLLILVNPVSGRKLAPKIWEKVKPLFSAAGIQLDVKMTERVGHAKDIVRNLDINSVDGIATVGGDGLFHEVVNGVMTRKDWRKAVQKLSLAPIPGGTGNALALTLRTNPFVAARNIIKGYRRPLDITRVIQELESGPSECWSFLTIQWAIVSDIDLKSETMRWMGDARFIVQGLKELMAFKSYHGKLSLLVTDFNHKHSPDQDKCTGLLSQCKICDNADLAVPQESSPSPKKKRSSTTKKKKSEEEAEEDSIPHLVDFVKMENTKSEKWITMEDNFSVFIAAKTAMISDGMMTNPFAHFSDGTLDVAFTRKSNKHTTRFQSLKFFLSGFETGTFVHHPMTDYYKVKAMKLEPAADTLISIDGERFPTVPTTVQLYHNVLNIFCEPEK